MTTFVGRVAAPLLAVLLLGLGLAPAPAASAASAASASTSASTSPSTAAERPAPVAQLTGVWVAHTRGLRIRPDRVVVERIGSGCCDPIVDVVLEIGSVGGTRERPRASAVVRQVVVHDPTAYDAAHPAPYVGQVAELRIDRRGILHESATRTIYCSSERYHPACGA